MIEHINENNNSVDLRNKGKFRTKSDEKDQNKFTMKLSHWERKRYRKRKSEDSLKNPNRKKIKRCRIQKIVTEGSVENQDNPDKKQNVSKKILKKKAKNATLDKNATHKEEETRHMKCLCRKLRSEKCEPDKKSELLEELFNLVKGRVTELICDRGTVTIIELILSVGTEAYCTAIFEESKDSIIPIAKSEGGKIFLKSMCIRGTKEQIIHIKKSFHNELLGLVKHTVAVESVEVVFRTCVTDRQKFRFAKELFCTRLRLFLLLHIRSLDDVFAKRPQQKLGILNSTKENLLKVCTKFVMKHTILHYVLWYFLKHCDKESRTEIIQLLREDMAQILHSEDGIKVAMHCIYHGTSKDHEVIVRSLKPHVKKLATDEFGHRGLLALFHYVDNTELIMENIVKQFIGDLDILSSQYGKNLLTCLVSRQDAVKSHASMRKELKFDDFNAERKKAFETRRTVLRHRAIGSLLNLLRTQFPLNYSEHKFCFLILTISKFVIGVTKDTIFKIILEILKSAEKSIDCPTFISMVKELIEGKDYNKKGENNVPFCESFINHFGEGELRSRADSNAWCLLFVGLWESRIPSVLKRIRSEMKDQKELLETKTFDGAKILLEKLS